MTVVFIDVMLHNFMKTHQGWVYRACVAVFDCINTNIR